MASDNKAREIISSLIEEMQDAKELCDHAVQALHIVDTSFFGDNNRNMDFAIHDGRRALFKNSDVQALEALLKKLDSLSRQGELPEPLENLAAQCRISADSLKNIFGDETSWPRAELPKIEDVRPVQEIFRKTSRLIGKTIRDAFGKAGSSS